MQIHSQSADVAVIPLSSVESKLSDKVSMNAVHSEVCGLSQYTRKLLLEGHIAVEVFKCVFSCSKEHKLNCLYSGGGGSFWKR